MTPDALRRARVGLAAEGRRAAAERALELGLITPSQLEAVLADPAPTVGAMLARGWISAADARRIEEESHVPSLAIPTPSEVAAVERDETRRVAGFVLVEVLGEGGFGTVWKAWDTTLGRWVALKVVAPGAPSAAERFVKEARLAARLAHENIVTVYGAGVDAGRPWLSMQLVDGGPARPADARTAAERVRQAAQAIAHAHRKGIHHRDVKPGNLLVDSDGRVRVSDFGLARDLADADDGPVTGTPGYGPDDVLALKATLRKLAEDPPAGLAALLARTHATPQDLADDLESFLRPRRRPWTGFGVAALLGVVALGLFVRSRSLDRARPLLEAGRMQLDKARVLKRNAGLDPGEARRHLEAARAAFVEALRLHPDLPEAHAGLGRVCVAGGDPAASLAHFDRAIDLGMEPARVERIRARIEIVERRTTEAPAGVDELRKEAEAAGGDAVFVKGLIALWSARYEDAATLLGEHVAREPWDGAAHRNRGHALLRLQRHREAAEAFTRAIDADARDWPALYHRALAREGMGEWAGVVADYEAFVRMSGAPRKARIASAMGRARERLGDLAAAGADLDEAIGLDPGLVAAWVNRASLKFRTGDFAGAVADATEALKLDPRQPKALNNRGIAKERLGDGEGALADYGEAVRLDPAYSVARVNRGRMLRKSGDVAGAMEDFDAALKSDPACVEALVMRGVVHRLWGDVGAAKADFDEALRLDPRCSEAYNNRGNLLLTAGRWSEAVQDFDRAIQSDARNANAWYNRGIARLRGGDAAGAVSDFSQALRIESRNPEAHTNRGIAHERLGDWKSAAADFAQALEIAPEGWSYRAMTEKKLKGVRTKLKK